MVGDAPKETILLSVPWSIEIVIMDGNMSESLIKPLWLLKSIRCAAGAPRSFEEAAAQSQPCEVTCFQPDIPTIGSLERSGAPHFGAHPEELRTSLRR